jgi:hypothetical protein
MQGSTGAKVGIDEAVFMQPARLFDNPVASDTANGMFHAHPERGNMAVEFFLFLPGSHTLGFFRWLANPDFFGS